MTKLADYLRNAAARFPGQTMPKYRRLDGLCRDGAPWAVQVRGRWYVRDEAAADAALGFIADCLKAAA